MFNPECSQMLCRETPEFALYYQAFEDFYRWPATECRILLCGGADVGKSALAMALNGLRPDPIARDTRTLAAINPRYIDSPALTDDFKRRPGLWDAAIGADMVVLLHDWRSGTFTDTEHHFLQALRHRFPDLGRRLVILFTHAGPAGEPRPDWQSGLYADLTTLLACPPVMLTSGDGPLPPGPLTETSWMRQAIRMLGRELNLLVEHYPGGITDMRLNSIKALLNAMDFWVARAIKSRNKLVAAGETELNDAFVLWQRDLQRLGDTLRTRINDYRRR